MVYGSLSGLAVWNEVSVALYCADIAPTRGARDGGGAGPCARARVVVCGGRNGTIFSVQQGRKNWTAWKLYFKRPRGEVKMCARQVASVAC